MVCLAELNVALRDAPEGSVENLPDIGDSDARLELYLHATE